MGWDYPSDLKDWPKWGIKSKELHRRIQALQVTAVNDRMVSRHELEFIDSVLKKQEMKAIISNVKTMLQEHERSTIINRFKVRAPHGYHTQSQKIIAAVEEAENIYTMFMLSM